MRGCGHAHHHDDLYLGNPSGTPPGYVDRELLAYWSAKDPLPTHRSLLLEMGVDEALLLEMETAEADGVEAARNTLLEMPWPEPETVTKGVTSLHDADTHAARLARMKGDLRLNPSDAPLKVGELRMDHHRKRRYVGRMLEPFNKPCRTLLTCTARIASSSVRTWRLRVRSA